MKNKFIPILISVLLLTQTVFGASIYDEWLSDVKDEDVKTSSEYTDAIDELNAIGVTKDVGFILSSNSIMTRGEFVSLVMNIELGLENAEKVDKSAFLDVPADSGFANGIYSALNMGIVSGNGSSLFEPNEPISYESAVKILVSILGYKVPAEESGGFPEGYLLQARKIGIGTIVPADYNKLTMGEAAFLVLEAVNTEVMEPTSIGMTTSFTKKADLTWLKRSRNTIRLEGIVEANKYTSLYNSSGVKSGYIRINGLLYETDVNMDNLLGMNVRYYLKNNKTVIYAKEYNNTVCIIESKDISEINGRTVSYYSNGKSKKTDIPKGVAVIYNNVSYSDYDTNVFNVKNGTIELIKSDSGSWNVVKINDWRPAFVTGVDAKENEISVTMFNDDLQQSGTLCKSVISHSAYDVFEVLNEKGECVNFQDIKKDTLLNLLISKDNTALIAYIGSKSDTGTVEVKSDNSGNPAFVINSYEIELSPRAMFKIDDVAIGDIITVYCDNFGRAAYIKDGGQANLRYGYLIYAAKSETIKSGFSFKIFDDSKEIKDFESDKKFYLNGSKITDFSNVPRAIENETVILYEENPQGMVKRIYTPDAAGSPLVKVADEAERIFYPGNGNYMFSSESTTAFTSGFCVDGNSIMFSVPNDALAAENDDFSLLAPSEFSIFERHTVSAYTKNTDSNIAEVILEKGGETAEVNLTNVAMVVVKIRQAVNDKGEQVHSLILNGKNVKDKLYYTTNSEVAAGIEVGDIIMPSIDVSGAIRKIRLIVDKEKKNADNTVSQIVVDTGVQLNRRWYANCSIFEGYVYSVKDGVVRFAQKNLPPEAVNALNTLTFKLKNLPVIEVDLSGDNKQTVEEVASDLITSYEDNNMIVNAILYVKSGTPNMLVLYK